MHPSITNWLSSKNDMNHFYFGGSGGYLLLHLLLLYRKHWCAFPHEMNTSQWQQDFFLERIAHPAVVSYINNFKVPKHEYINLTGGSSGYDFYISKPLNQLGLSDEDYTKLFKQAVEFNLKIPCVRDMHNHLFRELLLDRYLKEIITTSWTERTSWKDTELVPDVDATFVSTCPVGFSKVYHVCNSPERWHEFPGDRVILYTDIRSQIRLSLYKQAWYFFSDKKIPVMSQRQLIKQLLASAKLYKGELVHGPLLEFFSQAHHVIRLQDLVDYTNNNFNQDQISLIKLWKKQHPNTLLRKIGVEPDK